ncbi:hypothetical protein GCM10027082_47210 [Comamonas humi]
MKSQILNITIIALSLGLNSMAPAQSQPERGAERRGQHSSEWGGRGHRADRGHREERHDATRNRQRDQQYRSDYYHHADQGSIGNSRRWHRGERLPMQYRSYQYVVEDWRGHHLYAPPRGQYWVQSGSDYLLVVIATGVIAGILLSN